MQKLSLMLLAGLIVSVTACSNGTAKASDDTPAALLLEERGIEEIAPGTPEEADAPVAYVETPLSLATPGEKLDAAEEVSIPMSGELPKDDGTVSPPARATGTLAPTQPGQVLVNGQQEYEVVDIIDHTLYPPSNPYTPPQEDENASFSDSLTALKQKHDPQVKAGMFDCAPLGLTDCP